MYFIKANVLCSIVLHLLIDCLEAVTMTEGIHNNSISNGSVGTGTDSRIGLNIQGAYGIGFNPNGVSGASSYSMANYAGIRGPEGSIQTLENEARAGGSVVATGSGAPQTSAGTQAVANSESASGHGSASISGGKGIAKEFGSSSFTSTDLGGGYTLLRNLNSSSATTVNGTLSSSVQQTRPGQQQNDSQPRKDVLTIP